MASAILAGKEVEQTWSLSWKTEDKRPSDQTPRDCEGGVVMA